MHNACVTAGHSLFSKLPSSWNLDFLIDKMLTIKSPSQGWAVVWDQYLVPCEAREWPVCAHHTLQLPAHVATVERTSGLPGGVLNMSPVTFIDMLVCAFLLAQID